MFNFTPDMLLESEITIPSISHSKLTNESYFLTALETVQRIQDEYTSVKKELYEGLMNESSTDDFKRIYSKAYETSFPRKQDITVKESEDSTESFIKYFSDSIKILNTAIGNISGATTRMENQIPIINKESAHIIEACEKDAKDCHCPICGNSPCTCKNTSEKLFKYDTSRGLPITRIDFSSMEKVCSGIEYEDVYKNITEEVNLEYSLNKSTMCGLNESVEVSRSNYGRDILNSFGSSKRYSVKINKNYMDYCNESVLGLKEHVLSIKAEGKRIAKSLSEAVDRIEAAKNATITNRYIREDGTDCDLDNDQVQNLDLACKAKTDECISKCNDAIMALGAKLDMLNSEFNQCKAVIAQYSCGQDQPVALPEPEVIDISPTPTEPTDNGIPGAIQEDPDSDELPPEGEYGDTSGEEDDFDYDVDDDRPYSEALELFALDTIIGETQFDAYIRDILNESSDLYITEGLISSAKDVLNRIMQFLKKIWGKFTNSMNALFENDVKYLEENKNIIIGNTPKRVKIENWYDYKLDKINNAELKNINNNFVVLQSANAAAVESMATNSVVKKCGDPKNGKNDTFATYFNEYENTNFANTVDKFKFYFRESPKTLNANTLTQKQMTAMFDYCYSFKDKTLKVLKEEINSVNDMHDKAKNSLNLLDDLVPAEEEKKEGQNVEQNSARVDFSSIYNDYFAEDIDITNKTAPDKNVTTNDSPTKNAVNTQGTDDQAKEVEKRNNDATQDNVKAKGISKDTISIIKNYYDNVFGMTKDFVSTRLTVAESAYRDYMKLFRWHVGEYKGTKDKQDSSGDVVQPTNNGGKNKNEEDNTIPVEDET